jgi:hypothetical protein
MSKIPENLPSTKSKEFWEGAEIIKNFPETFQYGGKHVFVQKGNMAYCTTCPNPHGVFIDINNQEVQDGNIVWKEKRNFRDLT